MEKRLVKLEKSYFKDFEKQKELEKKALYLKEKNRIKAFKIHNLKYHTA
tara:strand:- start:2999 stop:3145 length:147 start_codon:yes stop_codon:yes gene_type:complete